MFPYVEFCLWDAMDDGSNFQRNFSIGEVEIEPDAIYHKSEYRERRNHYAVFWANRPYDGFDTARDAFIGLYGAPSLPEAVQNGRCTNSVVHGWAPVGAMQFHMALRPGESRELFFGLGYVENPEDEKFSAPGVINKTRAHAMIGKYRTPAQFDAAMDALHGHWDTLLSNYHTETGDEKVDRMVNIWNQYQCMVTFNMSRSASYFESGMGRGMGFRDSCQDLLGFVHIIPERARERILDIAATQFADGSAYHQYQPLTKKGNLAVGSGFNDDPLWLIAGVDAYLRETGDWSILDEVVTFDCDPDNAAPLMEHLRRSFRFTCTHLGPHKLPLIGRADWNDCLNLNCFSAHPGESFQITGPSEGPVAESVFIAGMCGEAVEVQAVVPVGAPDERQLVRPEMRAGEPEAAAKMLHEGRHIVLIAVKRHAFLQNRPVACFAQVCVYTGNEPERVVVEAAADGKVAFLCERLVLVIGAAVRELRGGDVENALSRAFGDDMDKAK